MNQLPDEFRKLSDEEWLSILFQSVSKPIIGGIEFPGFPEVDLQTRWVGSANEWALQEAYNFYKLMKDYSSKLRMPITEKSTILDFGVGWGRFLRFFWKDVDVHNIFGVDVAPEIIEICQRTKVPGNLSVIDPLGTFCFSEGQFSHVIAYSVFTHLSETAHHHWLREIARTIAPGGVFALTLEPRRFLDFVAQLAYQRRKMRFKLKRLLCGDPMTSWYIHLASFGKNVEQLRRCFDAGKIAYCGNDASTYGDAVVPLAYIEKMWTPYFTIREYIDDPNRFWQAVLIVQRR
jgi:SAM-dependent methyltransferase